MVVLPDGRLPYTLADAITASQARKHFFTLNERVNSDRSAIGITTRPARGPRAGSWMRLVFAPRAWEDYIHWQCVDRALVKPINRLIDDALRDPYSGIGKPEQLKYGIAGAWSRRITEERRLVHQVMGEDLMILQAGFPSRQLPR